VLDRQLKPQPKKSHSTIFSLGTPFGCRRLDAQSCECHDDTRLDFIPILAAGPTVTTKLDLHGPSEFFRGPGGRMKRIGNHLFFPGVRSTTIPTLRQLSL
jgi:hypothetical protein